MPFPPSLPRATGGLFHWTCHSRMSTVGSMTQRAPISTLLSFEISSTSGDHGGRGPRCGLLVFEGRSPIQTPSYLAPSSRGTVPHISQDTMKEHTSIRCMYTALEDYIEKAPHGKIPPVYKFPAGPHESPLRKFIALQKDALLVLGPRRVPPLPCPASSTDTAIAVVTAMGFTMLQQADYVEAVQKLRPDVVIGLGDIAFGHKPGVKRLDKMPDRTVSWINDLVNGMQDQEQGTPRSVLFAPILPIERDLQRFYLDALEDNFRDHISGLVLYGPGSYETVPISLSDLPRMDGSAPMTPHQVLDIVESGADILTIPFLNEASDAGIALDFALASSQDLSHDESLDPPKLRQLGNDLWLPRHGTDLSPLSEGCRCYSCSNHHRAYIQHLLNAKEMLAWVLLQIHNYHTLDLFFAAIRQGLQEGTFHKQKEVFQRTYDYELPTRTGQGPRIRGYQVKSVGGGEPKRNAAAWSRSMNDRAERKAEAEAPNVEVDAGELLEKGFAEKAT